MMAKYVLAFLLLLTLASCATVPPPVVIPVEKAPEPRPLPAPTADPFRIFPETFRVRALEHERKGELPQALTAWKIVRAFKPDDSQSLAKMEQLQQGIRSEANAHFQKGLDYLNKGSLHAARKEFLLALACNPEHEDALVYLKTRTNEPDCTVYEVKKGDTIEGIAKKIYGDQGKDFLVIYFNDLRGSDQLKPGMLLKLPVLEQDLKPEPKPEMKAEVKREAKPRPSPPPKAYDKAGAEDHYRKGLNYFLAEDLQGAIKEWEETLRLNPEHSNAKRDIERARSLLVSMGSK
jgi:tetratricopeptide (TPR) repeat protein